MAPSVTIMCLTLLLTWARVEGKIEVNLQDILRLTEYDGALRPQSQSGSTRVNVSMVIHSILVDETRQVLEVSGMLMQEWDDPSLSFLGTSEDLLPSITLAGPASAAIRNQVWCPDLTAGQQARPRGQDAEFLRISRHGHVSWSQRVHYDFPCKLDLSSYPLSVHKCTLILTSLGYEQSELDPAWQGNPPLDYKNVVLSHGYKLTRVVTRAETIYYLRRARRELHVEMTVSPRSGWAIKHTVIPMLATVTTAYLTFFINIRGACARMLTVMLSMVTAAIFHESAYSKVPPAHETMAIEVFTGTCLSFIFIAAVETVVVEVLSFPQAKGRRSATSPRNSFALEVRDLKPDLTEDRSGGRGQVAALWLDRCFRVLYPAGFLAFNAVYWVIYA